MNHQLPAPGWSTLGFGGYSVHPILPGTPACELACSNQSHQTLLGICGIVQCPVQQLAPLGRDAGAVP